VSLWAQTQALLGKRALGLRPEPRSTVATDRVWMGEIGERTDMAQVSAAPKLAAGHVSLELYAPPIGDQYIASWCVGEMIHGLVGITDAVYGLPYDPPSPLAAYRQSVAAHTPEGEPLRDEGTYIRVALSQIGKKGCATLAKWPRKWGQNMLEQVPAVLRGQGYNRRGLKYAFIVAFSIRDELDLADAAIAMKRPLGYGWSVTERYMRHRGAAPYDARLRKSDVIRGGHAEVQVSQRDEAGVIRNRGSWGEGFADGGYVNVIADTMTRRDLVMVDGYERLAGRVAV
jgi:hypothetical protein